MHSLGGIERGSENFDEKILRYFVLKGRGPPEDRSHGKYSPFFGEKPPKFNGFDEKNWFASEGDLESGKGI